MLIYIGFPNIIRNKANTTQIRCNRNQYIVGLQLCAFTLRTIRQIHELNITQIDVNTVSGVVRVRGQRLTLVAMTAEEVRIGGVISAVELVGAEPC